MALTNEQITAKNFKEFYEQIRPYLNGSFPTPVANKMSRGDLYSTNERMIGQWIDGKPIYQKTVDLSSIGTSASTATSLGIADTSLIVYTKYSGTYTLNSEAYTISSDDTIMSWSTSSQNLGIYMIKRNGYYSVYKGGSGTVSNLYVTVQYVKSTDIAIKIGNETDYSEDEQIIGSWIDGKPVYQKTINSGTLPNNTNKTIALDIPNIGKVLNIFGYGYVGTGSTSPRSIHLPFVASAGNIDVEVRNGTDLFISANANFSMFTESYITIQYLKTTD